jgi:hypothetical protein
MACLPSSTTSAVSAIIEKERGFGNLLVALPPQFSEQAADDVGLKTPEGIDCR